VPKRLTVATSETHRQTLNRTPKLPQRLRLRRILKSNSHKSPNPLGPIYLVGPTGVGKSSLACALAQQIGAEVIGADAFQLYSGLTVLTAQPTPEQQARVRHHLVGCIPITQSFDAANYHQLASFAMNEIQSRGAVPMVVGGTGLYARALIAGLSATPPADMPLRETLAKLDLPALVERLGRTDPAAHALVDMQNRRRVERAIEICETSGRPLSEFRGRELPHATGILLTRDRADLHARIAGNVSQMFDAGVVDEVEAARNAGPTASKAIGFKEICGLLDGEISEAECREKIVIATRQYARRQMTWFRHQTRFREIDLTSNPTLQQILDALQQAP
jgi:tRNA dimethylallyltransferase